MFQFFLAHPEIVDPLVMYGQLLTGLALLLGLAFRFAAAMGWATDDFLLARLV